MCAACVKLLIFNFLLSFIFGMLKYQNVKISPFKNNQILLFSPFGFRYFVYLNKVEYYK